MADRVASDTDAVTTYRARLARAGGTRRSCLRLPSDVSLAAGDFVRLVLDGETYHARVESDAEGALVRGAFDNRRLARTSGAGENRLVEWVGGTDRGPGDSVLVDEVVAGERYGVRVPGRRAVYEAVRGPDPSLSNIAERLDGDG
jgi:hypothetical protein